MLFGLAVYVYNPVVEYMRINFIAGISATLAPYAEAMLFIWSGLAGINLLISGVRLLMQMQRRKEGIF